MSADAVTPLRQRMIGDDVQPQPQNAHRVAHGDCVSRSIRIIGVHEKAYHFGRGNHLARDLKPFCKQVIGELTGKATMGLVIPSPTNSLEEAP